MAGEPASRLLHATAERAARYLDTLDVRAVAPSGPALDALSGFDMPLPERGVDADQVLNELDTIASPATHATAGGRYFGFVTGGVLPAALSANWLAAAWDQNTALQRAAPATALIERVALGWLLDLLRLPRHAAGAFVTGATMANFCALAAARHAVLARAEWNVEAEGLFGAPPVTVVISDEAHPTLVKALGLLGLGRQRAVRVPTDGQGRMRADALPRIDGPTIVCVQAGNVNTGAFDPVGAIVAHAHAAKAWVHVDGAFGLWARAARSLGALCEGLEDADSWATDAHKWLNVAYDNGLAFVRDGDSLRAAMSVVADYLPASSERNPSDFTPELSRRARGVDVWAALRSLGRGGMADLVEGCCRHANRLAEGLQAAGHEILNDVVLNQVLVSFGDAARTLRTIEAIQAEGTCWCGSTQWHGRTAMRLSVSSWATTDADVERSLEAIVRVARSVS